MKIVNKIILTTVLLTLMNTPKHYAMLRVDLPNPIEHNLTQKIISNEIKNQWFRQVSIAKMNKSRLDLLRSSIQTITEQEIIEKQTDKPSKQPREVNNTFSITAYDLSYNSCEKTMNDPAYGITKSGYNLKGMSREEAMTVAADPRVIPQGSKIYLEFTNDKYSKFNGTYTVRDVGGAIKGAKIDLFMGDFNKHETDQSVWDFGRTQAKVYLVKGR